MVLERSGFTDYVDPDNDKPVMYEGSNHQLLDVSVLCVGLYLAGFGNALGAG
jgi:hypothetical protein